MKSKLWATKLMGDSLWFVEILREQQTNIIDEIEQGIERNLGATFCCDCWGLFEEVGEGLKSGGITRVIQGGSVIEKGACSFILIQDSILTAKRAAAIQARQSNGVQIQAGDSYAAAALSMVLHTFPVTARSDLSQ
jgi:coproporphyrinogen III oxidase